LAISIIFLEFLSIFCYSEKGKRGGETNMALKRFVVEVGMGVDQHGQDSTRAAEKAVQDAIHRSCLCGLKEVAGLKDPSEMMVEVVIGCPRPESVDRERVLKILPLGQKRIEVRQGGLLGKTLFEPEFGDRTDEMVVANAIVTVYVP
jgi:uncharacterized protein (TIGR02058 family)